MKKNSQVEASGEFRETTLRWWQSWSKATVSHVYVKGDGYLRFEWTYKGESSCYNVPIKTVLDNAPLENGSGPSSHAFKSPYPKHRG